MKKAILSFILATPLLVTAASNETPANLANLAADLTVQMELWRETPQLSLEIQSETKVLNPEPNDVKTAQSTAKYIYAQEKFLYDVKQDADGSTINSLVRAYDGKYWQILNRSSTATLSLSSKPYPLDVTNFRTQYGLNPWIFLQKIDQKEDLYKTYTLKDIFTADTENHLKQTLSDPAKIKETVWNNKKCFAVNFGTTIDSLTKAKGEYIVYFSPDAQKGAPLGWELRSQGTPILTYSVQKYATKSNLNFPEEALLTRYENGAEKYVTRIHIVKFDIKNNDDSDTELFTIDPSQADVINDGVNKVRIKVPR